MHAHGAPARRFWLVGANVIVPVSWPEVPGTKKAAEWGGPFLRLFRDYNFNTLIHDQVDICNSPLHE